MSDVGQGQSQGKFFLVGRSDGGWRKEGSFYLALEPPYLNQVGGRRLEWDKVRGSFFQVGGQRAEGGVGRKGKFFLPFRSALKCMAAPTLFLLRPKLLNVIPLQ